MANFTRDWDESAPLGSANANTLDDIVRNLKVDFSDRLKTLIYGFVAGENDGNPGCKNLIFKQQASAPSTPNTDEIELYALDDGTNCGLYAKQEDSYTKQILKKIGTDLLVDMSDQIDDSTIEVHTDGTIRLKDAGTTFAKLAAAAVETSGDTLSDTDTAIPTSAAVIDHVDGIAGHDGDGYAYYDKDGVKTKVYTKYLTGTLDADATTNVAHGIADIDKILDVSAVVGNNGTSFIVSGFRDHSEPDVYTWWLSYNGTNIVFASVGSSSQGEKYRIRIDYIV